MDDRALLRTAADRLDRLAARTTPGDWRTGGLLATRPEVIAHRPTAAPSTSPRPARHGGLDHRPLPRRRPRPLAALAARRRRGARVEPAAVERRPGAARAAALTLRTARTTRSMRVAAVGAVGQLADAPAAGHAVAGEVGLRVALLGLALGQGEAGGGIGAPAGPVRTSCSAAGTTAGDHGAAVVPLLDGDHDRARRQRRREARRQVDRGRLARGSRPSAASRVSLAPARVALLVGRGRGRGRRPPPVVPQRGERGEPTAGAGRRRRQGITWACIDIRGPGAASGAAPCPWSGCCPRWTRPPCSPGRRSRSSPPARRAAPWSRITVALAPGARVIGGVVP